MKKVINTINKYKFYILLFIGIIGITFFSITFYDIVYKMFNKDTENLTIALNDDTDFYNWFIQFDELYNKKRELSYPKYSVNKEMFQKISNLLENKSDITYKDSKYYLNDNETLELDCTTRSFRYTNTKTNEIMEVNLINGKYYIQLLTNDKLYKITLNNKTINKKEKKSKDYSSIYSLNDFNW